MDHWQLWLVIAYLSGSVPFGLLLGFCKGVDIRKHGSGNVGATNCGRVLGRKWGLLCFALDVLKGFAPVFVAGLVLAYIGHDRLEAAQVLRWLLIAAAAVIGHVFPVWLKFQGGKGVATSLGVLLGVWPVLTLPGLATLVVWAVMLGLFRYVGLASVVAAVALPLLVLAIGLLRGSTADELWPFLTVTGVLSLLVVWRHRGNIARLIAGTEPKVGRKA